MRSANARFYGRWIWQLVIIERGCVWCSVDQTCLSSQPYLCWRPSWTSLASKHKFPWCDLCSLFMLLPNMMSSRVHHSPSWSASPSFTFPWAQLSMTYDHFILARWDSITLSEVEERIVRRMLPLVWVEKPKWIFDLAIVYTDSWEIGAGKATGRRSFMIRIRWERWTRHSVSWHLLEPAMDCSPNWFWVKETATVIYILKIVFWLRVTMESIAFVYPANLELVSNDIRLATCSL